MRKNTRAVRIGGVTVGGGNPVAVQSMLNVPIHDIAGNVAQAKRLEAEGCQIVRVTVPSVADVPVVEALKNAVKMPVVADIHFDYKVALACAEAGVDKIRINPGNIGDDAHVGEVASACRARGIPIRIGVNGGSLEKEILAKYGKVTPEALVESAMYHVSLLERHDFNDIVISIKSSNVPVVVEAYRQLSLRCDYPLHVGVTEAGTYRMGLIKSAMGIGTLLLEGIGDTIRVSLTDEPEKEVRAGFDILRAAGHFVPGPEVVSCPTCGRTNINVAQIASEVEERLRGCNKPIKVAVMGCVVNGPGEARGADIGIAGGNGEGLLFIKGAPYKKVKESELQKVADLETGLKKRIIGQDEAVNAVAAAVRRSRIRLSAKKRPASFIFVGPTGVGKTELVKVLSEELFDNVEPLIRLDMSEFMEKHSVSRIIGSPPGYVGYDEAGQLTEKVRRRPYSIVLFDEIEKAHPDVMNILLQILDEGRITDAQGRQVSFENTIIIMTSNAGSERQGSALGFDKTRYDDAKDKAETSLRQFLRPEFLARVDEVVVFRPLTEEDMQKIAALMLEELKKGLAEREIKFGWDDGVLRLAATEAYGHKSGARDLRNVLRRRVEDPICTLLAGCPEQPPALIHAEEKDGEIVLVTA